MMVRTQISLPSEVHRRAKARAVERRISLAAYLRDVLARDLDTDKAEPEVDITSIFGLGNSGGSDIARHKDAYVGEAVWQEHLRKTGGSPSSA